METFEVGNVVDVRGHGRATVLSLVTDSSDPKYGRCLVQYHEDDTTFYCNPKKLRLLHPSSKKVVVAYKTVDYQDAAIHNVGRYDRCLEIGCHEGTTVQILSRRSGSIIGVDMTPIIIERAKSRYPAIQDRFHCVNGFDVDALTSLGIAAAASAATKPSSQPNPPAKSEEEVETSSHSNEQGNTVVGTKPLAGGPSSEHKSPDYPYDRILIDLSGKAPLDLICNMIKVQRATFPDAQLIVKNEALFKALYKELAPSDESESASESKLLKSKSEARGSADEGSVASSMEGEAQRLLGDHCSECELFFPKHRKSKKDMDCTGGHRALEESKE